MSFHHDESIFHGAYLEATRLKKKLNDEATFTQQDLKERYQIIEPIGEGAVKKVFLTYDKVIQREVALAKIKADQPERIQDLLSEARLASKLEHPNIAPIYDIGLDETGLPFFVMKLYEGRPLNEELTHKKDSQLSQEEQITWILTIFLKVCDALSFAHSKGVLHLDIKPSNIRIDDYGEVLLCDWGISNLIKTFSEENQETQANLDHMVVSRATLMGEIRGTPGFMAPEQQTKSQSCDIQTDVYGLGALLMDMLTGSPQLNEASSKQPSELMAICQQATARQKKDRYQTVKDLIDDIEKFQAGQVTQAEKASFIESTKKWIQRNKKILSLILFNIGLIIVVFTVYLLNIKETNKKLGLAIKTLNTEKIQKHEEQLRLAKDYYDQAISAYHNTVSKFDFDTRDLWLAKKMMITSTQLNPYTPDAWGHLANLRLIDEEYEEAFENYSKAGKDYQEHYEILKAHLNILSEIQENSLSHKLNLIRNLSNTNDRRLRNHLIFKEIHEFHEFQDLLKFSIEALAICNNLDKINYTFSPKHFELTIKNEKLKTVYPLKTLPIKRLYLPNTKVGSHEIYNLRRMPLTHLDLSYCNVGHLDRLGNLGLTFLALEGNPLKNISILENYGITELNIAFIPADLNPVSKLKYLKKVICSPDQEKVLRELLAPHIDIKVKITPARESTK